MKVEIPPSLYIFPKANSIQPICGIGGPTSSHRAILQFIYSELVTGQLLCFINVWEAYAFFGSALSLMVYDDCPVAN